MNLISQIKEIEKKISGKILFDENLSKYSWFNLGGPAKVIFKPQNLNELSNFLKNIRGYNNIKVLGAGSNTLMTDNLFDGVVIKLSRNFNNISLLGEDIIIAGSGVLDKTLSDFAELSSDELIGGYDEKKGVRFKIDGYLEEFALTKTEADELIINARNIVFK